MKIAVLFTAVLLVVVISAVTADYASVYHWHSRLRTFLDDIPGKAGSKKGRRKRDLYLNKWRLRHSAIHFRSKVYEWGPPKVGSQYVSYFDGGMGRTNLYGWKWYVGRSRCTKEQADSLGRWYMRRYPTYRLAFNNCHHYAEWLANKLVNNRCTSYSYP